MPSHPQQQMSSVKQEPDGAQTGSDAIAPQPDPSPAEVTIKVESPRHSEAQDTKQEPVEDEASQTGPAPPAATATAAEVTEASSSSAVASEIDISHIRDEDVQWLWTAQEYKDWTPSRAVGLDAETERLNRYAGIKFIYQMGDRMNLFGYTLHSASTYFHRFFLRKAMKSNLSEPGQDYEYMEVAVACLLLATKTEEQHRKLATIIDTAIHIMRTNSKGANPLGQNTTENFRRWRDTVIAYEDELFPMLCADLVVPQPLSMFIEACQIFNVHRELIYNGIGMLQDMNRDIYCQLCEANVQAAAVFYVVHLLADCDYLEYEIPEELQSGGKDDPEQEFWLSVFYCEEGDMQECATAIREMYHWRHTTVKTSCAELARERERRLKIAGQVPSITGASPTRQGPTFETNQGQATPVNHRLQTPTQAQESPGPSNSLTPAPTNGHRSHRHNQDGSSSTAYTPQLNSSADNVLGSRQPSSSEQASSSQVPHPSTVLEPSSSPHSRYRQSTLESHDMSNLLSPEMPSSSPIPPDSSAFASQSVAVASGAVDDHRSGHGQHHDRHGQLAYNPESPVVATESDNDEDVHQGTIAGGDLTAPQARSETEGAAGSRWRPNASQQQQHRGTGAHDYTPVSPKLAPENDEDEEGAVNEDV